MQPYLVVCGSLYIADPHCSVHDPYPEMTISLICFMTLQYLFPCCGTGTLSAFIAVALPLTFRDMFIAGVKIS